MSSKVCLVSPGHVSSNPRLVKEADALVEAGYSVRLVAAQYSEPFSKLDAQIYEQAQWRFSKVTYYRGAKWFFAKLMREFCRRCICLRIPTSIRMKAWAQSIFWPSLVKEAASEPADIYIAHNLAALPAAYLAAQEHNALVAFDAEDFHCGELLDTPENQLENQVQHELQKSLLSHCKYVTAAAPMIADAYRDIYKVHPETILNVFPKSEFIPELRSKMSEIAEVPTMYWFSQTIGPNRGIEYVIQAMGEMKNTPKLYLRGVVSDSFRETLRQVSEEAKVSNLYTIYR